MNTDSLPQIVKDFLGGETSFQYSIAFTKKNNAGEIRRTAKECLVRHIRPFYRAQNISVDVVLYNIIFEPLRHANFHKGLENSAMVFFSAYASKAGLVTSYNYPSRNFDGIVPESGRDVPNGARGRIIYEISDLIHIDEKNKNLFIGISGKNGRIFGRIK